MSLNLPSHYVVSYSSNIQLLLQEKGSKLRSCVTEGHYVGKQASPVDQVGAVEMTPVTQRFAPKGRTDAAVDRRWVFPSDFDLPQQIDSFDKLRLLTDPESVYVTNAVYAAGRKMDALIITAFLATAKTGVDGTTSTSFTAGNEVDVAVGGSNSVLNVAKLLQVKRIMRANHVDFEMDPVYCALTARDEEGLLNEIQIISSDFNGQDAPVMRDGKISRFLGIDFVYCEQTEVTGAGTNECNIPVWAKSGMHLGIWNDVETSITRRYDLQGNPWEAYLYLTIGATRIEENKVYNIESYRA